MKSLNKLISLPANPSGFMGRIFGKLMELTNANAYHQALQALAPSDKQRFLEIGFGTGRFTDMLLSTTIDTFVAGVDPSDLMVETAITRLVDRGWGEQIELHQGNDDLLPWEDHIFDAVIAIHCFQFWPDPDRSLTEISRVLCPNGRIVIAFRDHAHGAPNWLPNPISRSGREIESAIDLLEKHKYTITEHPSAGSSRIIRADSHS